jgi:hypothetical protein
VEHAILPQLHASARPDIEHRAQINGGATAYVQPAWQLAAKELKAESSLDISRLMDCHILRDRGGKPIPGQIAVAVHSTSTAIIEKALSLGQSPGGGEPGFSLFCISVSVGKYL